VSLLHRLARTLRATTFDPTARLKAARVRALDRAYIELLALFGDAAEKQGEGFILDRRYVVSLGERALRLGTEVVFHANLLHAGCAARAYESLDACRARVRDTLAGRGSSSDTLPAPAGEASGTGTGGRAEQAPPVRPEALARARRERRVLLHGARWVICPGTACGTVVQAADGDLTRLAGASILVARQLEVSTQLISALGSLAAVIVEQGRPSDPLAALLRRQRIPTLFGARGAQERLSDGATVTVDADDGVVYEGRFEELLQHGRDSEAGRGEEPEYRLLRLVARQLGSPLAPDPSGAPADPAPATLFGTARDAHGSALTGALLPARRLHTERSEGGWGVAAGMTVVRSGEAPAGSGGGARREPAEVLLERLHASSGETSSPSNGGFAGVVIGGEESVVAQLECAGVAAVVDAVATPAARENHLFLFCRAAPGPQAKSHALERLAEGADGLGMTNLRSPRALVSWRLGLSHVATEESLGELASLLRETSAAGECQPDDG
jgi:phosphohistidine swiveling domain-containing protein